MRRALDEQRPVVLVVEDEFLIRQYALQMVDDAGFEAIEAANADEAITILEGRNDVRIVFTDIQMPGSIDGLKLAHAIRDRWPPIKLIVTSGHMIPPHTALPRGGRFVSKPYQPIDVTRALRELAV